MRHKISIYSAIVLLLGLTACTQDTQMTEGAEGTPMTFTATGLDFNEAHTRATVDGTWEQGNTVTIKIGNKVKPYTVSETGSAAELTSSSPFYWTSSSQTVTAWYPYNASDEAMPAIKVQKDQSSTGFAASDFLAAENQTVSIGAPTLKFVHRTARIAVKLTNEDAITVTDATVKFTNLDTTHVNPATITSHYDAKYKVYEALVAPQTIASGKIFIVVTLGDTDKTTYTYVPQAATTLEAGKQYTYTLSIKDNKLEFTGCEITDWTNGSTPTGGDIDYIVTADGTYIVYTAKGLYAWADAIKAKAKAEANTELNINCILANDITLPEVGERESNWEPVATDMLNGYTGTFDGNNHAITGVTINLPDSMMVGFFGCVGKGKAPAGLVKNLTLEAVNIKGGKYMTAGITAVAAQTSIQNCSTSGYIEGTGGYVGGVTGYCVSSNVTTCHSNANIQNLGTNETKPSTGGIVATNTKGGKITDCHFNQGEIKGKIYGRKNTGGIVGQNLGIITACHSSGEVEGDTCIGGVAGDGNAGWVIACYSTGTIKGESKTGGIAGETGKGLTAACYFTGKVTGKTNIGAVVGVRDEEATYYSCYWSGDKELNGVGFGETGEVTKIEGDTSWQTATSEMNKDIDYLNKVHHENLGQIEWMYICTDEKIPPTLQKTTE